MSSKSKETKDITDYSDSEGTDPPKPRRRKRNTNGGGSKYTGVQKWWTSIILGVLFFVLASNPAFNFTSSVFSGGQSKKYCMQGNHWILLILHTIIFILIVRFFLGWIN